MSDLGWLNVLAGRQEASERRRKEIMDRCSKLFQQGSVYADAGNWEAVGLCMAQLNNLESDLVQLDKEEYRTCSMCGGVLKPHSINWYEGHHIDGCEPEYDPSTDPELLELRGIHVPEEDDEYRVDDHHEYMQLTPWDDGNDFREED